MAKILITSEDRTLYLTGNLSRGKYDFTPNKDLAFCFDNVHEAIDFEEAEPVRTFLENTLTDLVDYDNPDKSIYS